MNKEINPLAQSPANQLMCWLCDEQIGLEFVTLPIDGAPEELHPGCAENVSKHSVIDATSEEPVIHDLRINAHETNG